MIGDNQPAAKKINNVEVTQSSQGYPVPVVLGCAKIHGSLLMMTPFSEYNIGTGKGIGGGKSGDQYDYFADTQIAICNGPITSVGSVWAGQTWFYQPLSGENVTLTPNYSPQAGVLLTLDGGVGMVNTYSDTYTDFGLPASTVLSGSDLAPMQLIPWFPAASPTTYAVGQQVFNGIDVYTCAKQNSGTALSNATYWTNTGAGLTTGQYSISYGSLGTLTLSSVANASAGSTAYTGSSLSLSGLSGASNAFAGYTFVVTGFTNPLNNGTFACTASSSTTITLSNAVGAAETHAASAADQGNVYHFSSADTGKSVVVSYQQNQALIHAELTTLVPSGPGAPGFPNRSVVLSQVFEPTAVNGVQYSGEFNVKAGQSFTQVSGTPSVAGTYQAITVNSATASVKNTYVVFASADVGEQVTINWGYTNESTVQSGAQQLNFVIYNGAMGQSVNSTIETGGTFAVVQGGKQEGNAFGGDATLEVAVVGAPGSTLGYTGIAHADFAPMYLGTDGQMQDITYEVLTPDAYGAGFVDANPVQCMFRVLTDTRWGLGTSFPSSVIDNSSSGTWGGAPGTPGNRIKNGSAWNWCAANSYFISPKLDSQETASSVMNKWLEAGQIYCFMSEGLMKLVPLGSTSVAANGCTWTAPQNEVVALDDTCFLDNGTKERIKIKRKSAQDAYNRVQVDFANRLNQYFDDVAQEWDTAAIARFGERDEDPQNGDFIHTLTAATFVASMRVKRMTGIWNEYCFNLPYAYSYLEPGDPILITTGSLWAAGLNNIQLAINNLSVRVTKVVDHPATENDGPFLEITCEDYPVAALQPVLYNKSLTQGTIVNMFANPGNTEAILFEATSALSGYSGNEVWIGACGESSDWGGCNVYVSQDGDTYLGVGTIQSQARIGTLDLPFPLLASQVVGQALAVSNNLPGGGSSATPLSDYVAGSSATLPGTVAVNVEPTSGSVTDVLLWASTTSGNPNGFMFRFDSRAGYPTGQLLKVFGGKWYNIGTDPQMVANYGFESGSTGWTVDSGTATFASNPSNAHTDNGYLQITGSTAYMSVHNNTFIPVQAGQTYTVSGWINLQAYAGDMLVDVGITSFDAAFNGISAEAVSQANTGTTGSWQYVSSTFTVAAGTSYIRVYCEVNGGALLTPGACTVWFDDVSVQMNNAAAIPTGTWPVACVVSSVAGGYQYDLFVNGYHAVTATDTTYTPTGAIYYGYESTADPIISPYSGSDPDSADSLIVNLEPNCSPLDSGTSTDADYLNTACWVDGEIISYSTATCTGAQQYTLSGYMRRGQFDSEIIQHTAGSGFVRLDAAVFHYTYPPQWAGQTLYFKFQSFNTYGNAAQELSTLTPVTFTVPGIGPGSIDAASGLVLVQSSFNVGAGPMPGAPVATT